MQIPIIGKRGQAKPYPSIPRIDWTHPLTSNLVSYAYDPGSGPIDLVIGQRRNLSGSLAFGGSRPTKYGAALKSLGGTSAAGCLYSLAGNNNTATLGVAAPYSFACGLMITANPTAFGYIFSNQNSSNTMIVGFAASNAFATDFAFAFANGPGTNSTPAGALKVNNFQTLLAVALTGSTTACYLDGALILSPAVTTTLASTAGAGASYWGFRSSSVTVGFGSIYYGAMWKNRALTASEARLLHDDPYCFLIYPEDEMFASLVGGAPFQWYPMDSVGLPEELIIRPRVEITGY